MKQYTNIVAALRGHLILPTDLDLAQILEIDKNNVSRARRKITLVGAMKWSAKLKDAGYSVKITATIIDGKIKWSVTDL